LSERPDLLLVAGDVNSSLACALVASKIDYGGGDMVCRRPLIGHVEAGLRSFDRTMPEEVNRIIADSLSDILFTPSPDANENLLREGNSASKIAYVGNIMIDTLEFMRPKIDKFRFGEVEDIYGDFGLVTLHRPSNVDETKALSAIVSILIDISAKVNLVFPIHPRTKKQLDAAGLYGKLCARKSLLLLEPLSYLKFMKLLFSCKFVLTDSGGIQEESTYLRKPCLTLRPNTERPITISVGTNELVNLVSLERSVEKILNGYWKEGSLPELWDGNTANRIVRKTLEFLDKNTE
jgi:UDP-N-acetylglucosamine 2-epimerase (non-hydrolysing)